MQVPLLYNVVHAIQCPCHTMHMLCTIPMPHCTEAVPHCLHRSPWTGIQMPWDGPDNRRQPPPLGTLLRNPTSWKNYITAIIEQLGLFLIHRNLINSWNAVNRERSDGMIAMDHIIWFQGSKPATPYSVLHKVPNNNYYQRGWLVVGEWGQVAADFSTAWLVKSLAWKEFGL